MSFTLEQFKEWVNDTFPDNTSRAIVENDFRDALSEMADFVFTTNSSTVIQGSIAEILTMKTATQQAAQAASISKSGAENQRIAVESLKQQITAEILVYIAQIQALIAQGFRPKGNYTIATNSPNLAGLAKTNGDAWIVDAAGTSSITGAPIPMAKGDVVHWNGLDNVFVWRPNATTTPDNTISFEKLTADIKDLVGYQEPIAIVNGMETLRVQKDANGDVYEAWFVDGTTLTQPKITLGIGNGLILEKAGTTYTLKNGSIEGEAPFGGGVVSTVDEAFVDGKRAVLVFRDSEKDVYWCKFEDGTDLSNPVNLPPLVAEMAAARGSRTSLAARLSSTLYAQGLPKTIIWNSEKLRLWNAWKRNQDSRYDLVCIGDSYTHGGYFTANLRAWLISEGYLNGGAGWCGFNRWGDQQVAINNAINNALVVTYTYADWTNSNTNALNMGVDGYITSVTPNSILTLTANEATDNVSILFEKHAGAGDFQYRIGTSGAWTTVPTAAAVQDTDVVMIITAGSGANFVIQIQALAAGVILCGAIARKGGNVLAMHKAGISGATAAAFAQSALWGKSVTNLTPKGAVIMFTTNEMNTNTTPDAFKVNVQRIITKLRLIHPICDIILAAETFTKYEMEDPRIYKLQDYANVLFELADENHCAFVNHSVAMGPFSQALIDNGFMNSDRVHPNPKGGLILSDNFFKLLKK